MPAPAEPTPSARPDPGDGALRGIAFKIGSVLIFLLMYSLLKASAGIPTGEQVFFRSSVGIVPVLMLVAWRGELGQALKTASVASHLRRGFVGTVSMWLGFFALTKLPLPEAVTINYTTPLLIVVAGALFANEVVRLYRWSAVIVGLGGVMVIAWPRLTLISAGVGGEAALGLGAALGSCVLAAVAMLLVRRLVVTERSSTIVLYFLMSSSVIALVTLPFGWVVPDMRQLACLIGAGLSGGIAQIMLTEAYRHAEMSVVAPFEYSSLIFSVAIGYLFFGDVPTLYVVAGGLIVVGSGLFIIFREHRLGLDRRAAREVAPPQA